MREERSEQRDRRRHMDIEPDFEQRSKPQLPPQQGPVAPMQPQSQAPAGPQAAPPPPVAQPPRVDTFLLRLAAEALQRAIEGCAHERTLPLIVYIVYIVHML